MGWKRAVHPEQKAERRAEILSVAGELVDEGGLEAAGINAIARRVGYAKANLYRYFVSREAILIELMLVDIQDWCDSVISLVEGKIEDGVSIEDRAKFVAKVLTNEMGIRERMCVLMVSLSTVLEQNVDEDTVISMKRRFYELTGPLVEKIGQFIPEVEHESVGWFLQSWMLVACQIWSYAHPSEIVKRVLAMEEFSSSCVDFDRDSERLAMVLIAGLNKKSS